MAFSSDEDGRVRLAAPKLWNALPHELLDIPNLHNFKSNLKTYLFKFALWLNEFQLLHINTLDFYGGSVYIFIVLLIVNRFVVFFSCFYY